MQIDKDSLEKALNSADLNKPLEIKSEPVRVENQPQISREEEIGFHKGALNTLVAERNELFKMIGNVEAIMQAHIKRLEELGIRIDLGNKQ